MMFYKSTRGSSEELSFKEVTLTGLASDGGLYVPRDWNNLKYLKKKRNRTFQDVIYFVISQFIGNSIDKNILKKIIKNSYDNFSSKEITPLQNIKSNHSILELFHGPTLAFKDIALQLLGNLFNYYLEEDSKHLTIIGATSGDTGSAAIEAVKGVKNINIFILHPYNRVSEFQRRQMTTVKNNNVFNIAVKGNFDDCQAIVKNLFQDKLLNKKIKLGSINSINWTRIMAQISYYIYAFSKIQDYKFNKNVVFSVPTGNFGDAYAGYLALAKFKVPIKKIIVATNKNDILDRFFKSGRYSKRKVVETISPSMDIQVASNFERLLYDLNSSNGRVIYEAMKHFKENDYIQIDNEQLIKASNIFCSYSVTEKETIDTMKTIYNNNSIILDPHTAVGVKASENYMKKDKDSHIITLATAHPSKFSGSVRKAIGIKPNLPKNFSNILKLVEKYEVLDNNYETIRDFILFKS